MKAYTVRIETSVLVTADDMGEDDITPEYAQKIALGWLAESIYDSNPIVKVYEANEPYSELGALVRTDANPYHNEEDEPCNQTNAPD